MAEHDGLDGDNAGFVPLFAGFPQLCAGALAGLGSALWLNVVGPFAGLAAAWGVLVIVNALAVTVVAVLAVLVTTAATLLAADWRADAASRQAWTQIDVAAVELYLPAGSVAPPQIDPRYLTTTDCEPLRSVFGAPRCTSLAPELEAASCSTRTVVASGGSIPPVRLQVAPTSSRKTSPVAGSDADLADATCQRVANASLGQEPLIVASSRALKQVSRAQRAVGAPLLVANGGAWPEWLPRQVPSAARIADNIVLSGDRGDRHQPCLPSPAKGDSTVNNDEPPSCRGPPNGSSKVRAVGAQGPADPIVCDNLGRQVPICPAELDVIETYLEHVLREVLATPGSDRDSQTS
jgi:hypothetical protein